MLQYLQYLDRLNVIRYGGTFYMMNNEKNVLCFIEYFDDVLHISDLDWYSVADHSETVNDNSNLDTKITSLN